MTPKEAGKACRVTAKTMVQWAKKGYLPSIRLPNGRFLFRACDIAAILAGVKRVPDAD